MGFKDKIAQEVNKAVLPEMQDIMVKAHERVKESQKAFLDQITERLELWEIEIMERVDKRVQKSLTEYEEHDKTDN